MRIITLVFVVLIIFVGSCQKDGDPKEISYTITGLSDPYSIVYLNASGKSISERITPSGSTMIWNKNFTMEEGSPVYLYLKFKEDISSSMSFNMGIIINGKYAYQAKYYEKNNGDTIFEVKRAGIVPYN